MVVCGVWYEVEDGNDKRPLAAGVLVEANYDQQVCCQTRIQLDGEDKGSAGWRALRGGW